jgi:serine/threonine protein phosphatase PrpC
MKHYCKEIISAELTVDDKFMVIASDGVWEYMTNEEVIENLKFRWLTLLLHFLKEESLYRKHVTS